MFTHTFKAKQPNIQPHPFVSSLHPWIRFVDHRGGCHCPGGAFWFGGLRAVVPGLWRDVLFFVCFSQAKYGKWGLMGGEEKRLMV